MSRKVEFIKKSEARILIYLENAANHRKNGTVIGEALDIDYIYLMKLLKKMYSKEWIKTHLYNKVTYFDLTEHSPMKYAKERLIGEPQAKLRA